jgi:flavoprotein
MITGNITISSRPSEDELRSGMICGSCLDECNETGIDESFSDAFGLVTCWGVGSDCCEAEVYEGRIFLDEVSYHTARKDHKDGKVKAGQRYRSRVRKGYYIDDSGKHYGIFEVEKKVVDK